MCEVLAYGIIVGDDGKYLECLDCGIYKQLENNIYADGKVGGHFSIHYSLSSSLSLPGARKFGILGRNEWITRASSYIMTEWHRSIVSTQNRLLAGHDCYMSTGG